MADRNHQFFKPIEVRAEVIFMRLKILKLPLYRHIIIFDSTTMKEALTKIPEVLVQRATIVDHNSKNESGTAYMLKCFGSKYHVLRSFGGKL